MLTNNNKILSFVPASPGFYVLSPIIASENKEICGIDRTDVIGWALDESGVTWPVSVFELLELQRDQAILYPDGHVATDDDHWESLEEWLNAMKNVGGHHVDLC